MSVNNIDPNVRLASLIRDAHFHIKPTHLTKIDKEGFIDALDAKNLDYDVVEIGGNTVVKTQGACMSSADSVKNVEVKFNKHGDCLEMTTTDKPSSDRQGYYRKSCTFRTVEGMHDEIYKGNKAPAIVETIVLDVNGKTLKSSKGNVGIYDPFGQCMPIAAADDFVGSTADFIKNQKSWSA